MVSVIVPVYNLESLIERCIKSIINQTYKDLEIIIINDGSTDNSEEIIEKYAKQDKRIKYHYKENSGQATTRNLGIDKSKGKYILFVDGDDWIELNMIEDMVNSANEETELVISDYYIDYYDITIVGISVPHYSDDETKNLILSNPGPCYKLYKSNIIKKHKPFFPEGIIYEDLAIIPYINSLIKSSVYLKKPYYHYCIRENSTIHKNKFHKNERDVFLAVANLQKKFNGDFPEEVEFIFIRDLLYFSNIRNLFFVGKDVKMYRKDLKKTLETNYPNWRKNKYHMKEIVKLIF